MCGIVGAVAQRDVAPILVEGLRRLEYRGYDSAGVAVLNACRGSLQRFRTTGKVSELESMRRQDPLPGNTGVAHTRWATHGKPTDDNAHPHICRNTVAVVHNGIIENHEALRTEQREQGLCIHLGDRYRGRLCTRSIIIWSRARICLAAVQTAVTELHGAYALGVVSTTEPGRLVAARRGSPLVIGLGIGENFIASDVAALLPVTQRFMFLEDGDVADLRRMASRSTMRRAQVVKRIERVSELTADAVERGEYRHYMLKEIFEQPRAVADTLEGRIERQPCAGSRPSVPMPAPMFDKVQGVHIIACGTSYHAGMVGRYWLESIAGVPCSVEVASEFRYRQSGGAQEFTDRHVVAIRRDRGHAGRTARGRRLGFGIHWRSATCRKVLIGARIGTGVDDPRRPRNWRRLDQGLHHATGRLIAVGAGAGPAPRMT